MKKRAHLDLDKWIIKNDEVTRKYFELDMYRFYLLNRMNDVMGKMRYTKAYDAFDVLFHEMSQLDKHYGLETLKVVREIVKYAESGVL